MLANQVVLTPLAFEVPELFAETSSELGLTIEGRVVNPDAWDGYPAERERLLAAVGAAGPTIVVTGDVHSSWAFEVPGPDDEPVAVEWVTPSVTASPFSEIVGLPSPALAAPTVDLIGSQLPQVRWAELTEHGFLVVALRPDDAQCDWWHVDLDEGGAEVAASWSVTTADSRLREASPLGEREVARPPSAAPDVPPRTTTGLPGEADDGPPVSWFAGAAAAGGAALAAVVALRRRREG